MSDAREPSPIDLGSYQRIVVLTGAGISVASGLRPYRGPGGLWEEGETARLADVSALAERPDEVWRFFAAGRRLARAAEPNAAHRALAALERRLAAGQSLTLLTQNVDGLHRRAGSREVVELHGSLHRARCADPACVLEPLALDGEQAEGVADEGVAGDGAVADGVVGDETVSCPRCPRCGGALRPDVVLFGEPLPVDAEHAAKRALRDSDLFLAVGTSGTVTPAASFVRWAEYAGARTILVNLEPMDPPNPAFSEEHLGPAELLLPALLADEAAHQQAEPAAELLEVVDDAGRVIGQRRRDEIHGDPTLAHRAVHVLVFNAAGELFLQQRSRLKKIQPGRWDSSVGGHVDPGEGYEVAAARELGEELGVALGEPGSPLERLHDYVWRTAVETEHVRTFRLRHEGPFSLHPAEIEAGRFWSAAELRGALGSGQLTPNLEHELALLGVVAEVAGPGANAGDGR